MLHDPDREGPRRAGSLPVSAVVLAAGLSRRMGRLKLTLPWGETTVIGQVLSVLRTAGITRAVVVTGHRAAEVEAAALAAGREGSPEPSFAHNSDYETGEMLSSIQVGLAAVEPDVLAALLCLGDQPQIEPRTVEAVLAAGDASHWESIIIPSYRMRGGHPILLPRALWPAVAAARESLRAVLNEQRASVRYLDIDSPSILADLDTPDEYQRSREVL